MQNCEECPSLMKGMNISVCLYGYNPWNCVKEKKEYEKLRNKYG